MAKNYQAKEAYAIVEKFMNGDRDIETMTFMARFPALTGVIIGNDIKSILNTLIGSARQVESALRGGKEVKSADNDEAEADDEAEDEVPAKKSDKKEKQSEPEDEEADEDDDDEPKKGKSKYDGLSTKELYNLCIKAGLKAKIKQEASYYVEKLEYADKKAAEAEKAKNAKPKKSETTSDDDDWDEDETPPVKEKAKKENKKASTDAEDDEWNF